jgi:hypothetical protein
MLLLMPATAHAQDAAISNTQITAAISKSVAWIYRQQNAWGTWEVDQEPTGTQRDLADQGQFGFQTALAIRTLLAAGESEHDARMQTAIDFLIGSPHITGVYAVGMRAQVWPLLTRDPAVRQIMVKDLNTLVTAMHTTGRTRGLFSYRTDFTDEADYADHSVSFYGTMGIKALADAGLEVPSTFWATVERAWRSQQQKDGSWVYRIGSAAKQERTMGMTASGIAVLLGSDDELAALRPADCRTVKPDANIDPGLDWMDANFDQSREGHEIGGITLKNYALYALARIGMISGRKYFGQRDWYQDGAKLLLKSQNPTTGAWDNLPDTCFAVLFLTRGRNPIIVSKLEYDVIPTARGKNAAQQAAQPPGVPTQANWNLRPRDLASLTDWLGTQVEQEFNWETVTTKTPVEEMHDSAILYISGNQRLNLMSDDKKKLKQFIEEGGILFGNADCASKEFSDSFRSLGTELFPAYEFRNVPKDSVIFTGEEYRAAKWKFPPQVLELNNGVRDLMLLVPEADPSRFFEQRQIGSRQDVYELLADILFYSVDQSGARLKGDTYIVRPNSQPVRRSVKVARLEYGGNWDPEPGGWVRLAAVMHNTRGIDLQVQTVIPGDGKLNSTFKLAHLTGTANFHLGDSAREEIKRFVDRGGVLVIDAAGGSQAFDAAAQTEIKAMFPDGALELLTPDNAIYSAGSVLTRPSFRRFERSRLPATNHFRLEGFDEGTTRRRTSVIYSAEDITEGLVGQPVDGVYGYQPQSATNLMANLVTYAAGK